MHKEDKEVFSKSNWKPPGEPAFEDRVADLGKLAA